MVLKDLQIKLGTSDSFSEISNSNSSSAKTPTTDSRIVFSFFERDPDNILLFMLAASTDRDCISFDTDSAWTRSSFPFRKARFVNSPGPARRAPRLQIVETI